jgi:uncharacterized protein (TIGR02453 family)
MDWNIHSNYKGGLLANSKFAGFPEAGVKFFRSLERNNRREWFQPRKETFDSQLKAPMVALVESINGELAKFAPDYISEPQSAIYRIYRDTRFSSDKTPYKTHVAASFRRRGMDKHAAASFYFSISHKEVEVAGGVYMPGPEQLLAIRTHMAENYQQFSKIVGNVKLKTLMEELKGDQLSRVPKGFAASHPAADLVRKKQWLFYVTLEPTIVTTPDVFGEVVKRFKVLTPVVEFLNAPLKPRKPSIEDLLV